MADANLGSDLISVIGAGAQGFNVNTMVNGLVSAERVPVEARLDRQQETTQAKLDAFTAVRTAMSGFQNLLSEINDLQKMQARSFSSSSESTITATADNASGTLASPGSYQVEVTSLAQAHSLYSGASYENTADTVGTGTINISFGTWNSSSSFTENSEVSALSIAIDSSNSSLQGVAGSGKVTASIINDGSGNRLVLTSAETGANHAMNITVSGDGDGNNNNSSGLSNLVYSESNKNLSQSMAGTDATAVVNGLTVSSSSNTLNNVIEGVTLNLHATSIGSAKTITVGRDVEGAKTAINNFVGDYNALMTVFDEYAKYDGVTAGALQGESLVRSIISDVKMGVSAALESMPANFQYLSDIGVSKDRYGKMEVDSAKLDSVLTSDYDTVARMFARGGAADDSLVSFISATDDTKVGSYDVNITSNYVPGTPSTSGYYRGDDDSYLSGSDIEIDGDNNWFNITVDGVSSTGSGDGRIYLNQGTYNDAESLAAHIQSQINADGAFTGAGKSVAVSVDRSGNNPRLVITSDSTGVNSTVRITDGDRRIDNDLGLNDNSASWTDGVDGIPESVLEGTINGQPAVAEDQYHLRSLTGDSKGLVIDVRGTTTGDRGQVHYTKGFAAQLDDIMDRVLKKGEALDLRINGLNDRLEDIDDQRTKLDERLVKMEARWRQQFNALNALMGQMQSTGNFLTQTFKSLNGGND